MELGELVLYAREKYGLTEQFKWAEFPGFSAIAHPQTGKWIALLMRQWDTEQGELVERADIRSGPDPRRWGKPYLSAPLRMHGEKWVGVAFGPETEPAVVKLMLDMAVGRPAGATLFLEDRPRAFSYRDTPLPVAPRRPDPLPEPLRRLRRPHVGGDQERARHFVTMGRTVADYEDDTPWRGDFRCYLPVYADLPASQLRGYFGWRTQVRRGEYPLVPSSVAYLYIYELLNGIGAESPEERLEKLLAFEAGFPMADCDDRWMGRNLRRWMMELAIVHGLAPERVRAVSDPARVARDDRLLALREAETREDAEVFDALNALGGGKLANSPVVAKAQERGMRLFADTWRNALRADPKRYVRLFGEALPLPWHPLESAVYYVAQRPADTIYTLNPLHSFTCAHSLWTETCHRAYDLRTDLLKGFLHGADRVLRLGLKLGAKLAERKEESWVTPCAEAALAAEREAARPKVTLNLGGLEQIRRDALVTRDSLLTEEDWETVPAPPLAPEPAADLPLAPEQLALLRALLRGEDLRPLLAARHLLPSLAADGLNEALLDELGDTAIYAEGDTLILEEDYREELCRLLHEPMGGT